MHKQLLTMALLAALGAAGCTSECESACEDWSDTCSHVWDGRASCEALCDDHANQGVDDEQAACYGCFARHSELCIASGSETFPGQPCYNTCSIDE